VFLLAGGDTGYWQSDSERGIVRHNKYRRADVAETPVQSSFHVGAWRQVLNFQARRGEFGFDVAGNAPVYVKDVKLNGSAAVRPFSVVAGPSICNTTVLFSS